MIETELVDSPFEHCMPDPYLVNVGVPDFGDETDAGRRVRVVTGKFHVSLEQFEVHIDSLSPRHSYEKIHFLNFSTVFLTVVRMRKLRKDHCSPPPVGEDNLMVFNSHSVPFPATRDLRSLVAGNGTS